MGGLREAQRTINIKRLRDIRDDDMNKPIVRLQAIQTMQKLISEDDPITQENIDTLIALRDSSATGDGVRIGVIQSLQKILDLVEGESDTTGKPAAEDIMNKIRSAKK